MDGARTRGQPAALAAARAVLAAGTSHALLLLGPAGVGKTTLALDLAATLLCTAEPFPARPCRACRGCRMVDGANHPDLHWLRPDGAGGQVRIGERANADPNSVRGLASQLALLPVEGGQRVAIVEGGHRMNDDAQSALLKTLEEPPAGVTLILCADEEERLLPTVRSRCARIRLGPVGVREIEQILGELGAADAPTAARLGRIAGGRPGVALAYARAPEAMLGREEIVRSLLDLLDAPRAARLAAIREVLATAATAADALARGSRADDGAASSRPAAAPSRARQGTRPQPAGQPPATGAAAEIPEVGAGEEGAAPSAGDRRAPPAERRRAAAYLVELWRDLARDLALAQLGDLSQVRDHGLLDDLAAAAPGLPRGAAAAFLVRLTRAGELLEANVSPELVADGLVLRWPRRSAAA